MALKEENVETGLTVTQPVLPVRILVVNHQQVEAPLLVDPRQFVGGRGVFSLVHLGSHNLGRAIVIKLLPTSSLALNDN